MTREEVRAYKIAYNKLITTYNKFAEFLDNPKTPQDQKEEFLPKFNKLIENIERGITSFKEKGIPMNEHEMLNGFDDVKL